MRTIVFSALLWAISPMTYGQEEFKCGLTDKLRKLYEENPQLATDHEELLKSSLREGAVSKNRSAVLTIPVVFHIVHEYGAENISDAQIYDQMEILNEDFRLLNQDTAEVIGPFKQRYADVGIEFKLASVDPSGNCTNGIDRIFSHETNVGDDYSKLNQWPRFRYLNIWVVSSMENGVAGYAYYPTSVDGLAFFRDGIIIRHNYIGSIGTGSVFNSRALTHEIGHFLGLAHPWGSTNEPGVNCGDDFIPDTPETQGSELVCNLNLSICNPGVIENVQNYMDYSYCSTMFTIDQATAMRNVLQDIPGQRSTLISEETAELSGINLTTSNPCKPIADFNAESRFTCVGKAVQFSDFSYNGPVEFREWTFYDETPIVSTEAAPVVTFSTTGYKRVRLIVGNAYGADTLERTGYVFVANSGAPYFGPNSFDLNSQPSYGLFSTINHEYNRAHFHLIEHNGYDNSKCFKLNNFFDNSDFFPLTEEGMYYNRLGGSVDELITPAFNLTTTTNVAFTFKYAYATYALTPQDITESIKVYVSRNCGDTWTLRETITAAELVTMGYQGATDRHPLNNSEWKTATLNYSPNSTDTGTLFKIAFQASDNSGNLYIDNINLEGVLALDPLEAELGISIYPNPAGHENGIHITFESNGNPINFVLRDLNGKIVKSDTRTESIGQQHVHLDLSNLQQSCYFLEIQTGDRKLVRKIAVL